MTTTKTKGAASDCNNVTRTLKCRCNKFQADLKGDPLLSVNCFCHSCVSAMKFIQENYGRSDDDHDETTAQQHLFSLNEHGGMAISIYNLSKIRFHCLPSADKDDSQRCCRGSRPQQRSQNMKYMLDNKLGMVKVGEKGDAIRYYTKCCGTMVIGLKAGMYNAFVNRLAIYENNDDDNNNNETTVPTTKKYVPQEPIVNMMAKHSFEPSDVPEPKAETIPIQNLWKFIKMVFMGIFGIGKSNSQIDTNVDVSKAEIVPITW